MFKKEKKGILFIITIHPASASNSFAFFTWLMHLFYSVLLWGHEGREVHTLLFLSKIKDKVSYRKNDSASKQGDNNYFLSCYLSVSNDQKPCFVSFPKCWYKSMNKDTKNHIIDASLGITSTHTETGKIAHREKEVQKATKNGMRKKKNQKNAKRQIWVNAFFLQREIILKYLLTRMPIISFILSKIIAGTKNIIYCQQNRKLQEKKVSTYVE